MTDDENWIPHIFKFFHGTVINANKGEALKIQTLCFLDIGNISVYFGPVVESYKVIVETYCGKMELVVVCRESRKILGISLIETKRTVLRFCRTPLKIDRKSEQYPFRLMTSYRPSSYERRIESHSRTKREFFYTIDIDKGRCQTIFHIPKKMRID